MTPEERIEELCQKGYIFFDAEIRYILHLYKPVHHVTVINWYGTSQGLFFEGEGHTKEEAYQRALDSVEEYYEAASKRRDT